MKNNIKTTFNWKNYIFFLKNEAVISEKLMKIAITNFWKVEMSKVPTDYHILIMLRVVTTDNLYKTLGTLRVLNKDDLDYYITYINAILSLKLNDYEDLKISKIVFSYGIREGLAPINTKEIPEGKSIMQNYKHYKLPISMDPIHYGNLINTFNKSETGEVIYVVQSNKGNVFEIEVLENNDGYKTNKVKVFRNGL